MAENLFPPPPCFFEKKISGLFFLCLFFFSWIFFLYTEIFCYTHTRARTRAH